VPLISESLNSQSQLQSGLEEGLNVLSQNQTITFTKYVRLVLPIDGFVFWVKASLLSPSALYNASAFNRAPYDTPLSAKPSVEPVSVQGSFHYLTQMVEDEAETMAVNQVIFTTTNEIQDLNEVAPNVLFIGEFEGVRFAFSRRDSFYKQAGLNHYVGQAVTSIFESQIIDDPADFDSRNVVVSNSLPIWLMLNKLMPMYPSFLVPQNTEPVYAAVHIEPGSTQAIQMAPHLDRNLTHTQLVRDQVRITMYGMRNFNALDFQDYVFQYTLDHDDVMGISNMPIIRDEKKTMAEMNVIAMKKSIVFDVNYYQTRVNDATRQLILKAIPTFYFSPQISL
jgi:hypothetical protein